MREDLAAENASHEVFEYSASIDLFRAEFAHAHRNEVYPATGQLMMPWATGMLREQVYVSQPTLRMAQASCLALCVLAGANPGERDAHIQALAYRYGHPPLTPRSLFGEAFATPPYGSGANASSRSDAERQQAAAEYADLHPQSPGAQTVSVEATPPRDVVDAANAKEGLSLIHISEPTRPY